jgi:divalent metal cation (Fe/Co/Zn/Cd) transporter
MTEHLTEVTTLVVALKTVTLVLGGLVTYFALKAYRRTDSPALRALAIGFGVVTLGAFLAGLADQIVGLDRTFVLVIESALAAVGFGIITYSLYVD